MTALSPAVGAAPSPPGTRAGAGAFVFTIGANTEPLARLETSTRVVPDTRGLSMRDAAALLHGEGFSVRIEGRGPVATMAPDAGRLLPVGSVVTLRGSAGSPAAAPPPDSRSRMPDPGSGAVVTTISLRGSGIRNPETGIRNPDSGT
jgi:hypothetical protein